MKKIQKLLLVLLLIPCMLLVGCSSDISSKDYETLKGDSAVSFYQEYYGKNMTVTFDINDSYAGCRPVSDGDGSSIWADYSYKQEGTCTIEVFDTGLDAPNMRVTTVGKVEDIGYTGETYGITSYENIYQYKNVVTYICSEYQGKKEVKQYYYYENTHEEEGKEVVDIRTNTYTYSYLEDEEGYDAIWDALDRADSIFEYFYSNTSLLQLIAGITPEYFQSNGSFGYVFDDEISSVDFKTAYTCRSAMEVKFENNLPSSITLNEKYQEQHADAPDGKLLAKGTQTMSVQVEYQCDEISKPDGFENAREYPNSISVPPIILKLMGHYGDML